MTSSPVWLVSLVWLALAQPAGETLQRDRNLGKAHYERGEYALAVELFERVIARDEAVARDYFNAGMAYLQNQEEDRALAALTTAHQMEPALVEVDFGLGVLHKRAQRHPLAREAFQRVVARDPDDPCTWFNLGAVSFSMGLRDEAAAAFERVLEIGHPRGQNFYVSALFRYAGLLSREGSQDEARAYFAEFETLRQDTPNVALTPAGLENGRYGRVELPPNPSPELGEALRAGKVDSARLTFVPAFELPTPECETTSMPALSDFDADGLIDVFLPSPCADDRLFRNAGGDRFEDVTEPAGLGESRRSLGALFADLDNSGGSSLYLWSTERHQIFRNVGGRFENTTDAAGLSAISPPATAIPLDADNDGQLDLLLGGPAMRLSLVRNDGDGTFTEIPVLVPPDTPASDVTHVAAADFDQDGFTDVLVARDGGASLLMLANEGGSFRTTVLPLSGPRGKGRIDLVDIDRDSWIDVVVSSDSREAPRFFHNRIGRLESLTSAPAVSGPLVPIDADADGAMELLLSGGHLVAYRADGRFEESAVSGSTPLAELTTSAVAADLEGQGNVTLLLPGRDGRTRARVRQLPEGSRFIRLALAGTRTNRQAVGALVELKAGRFYQRVIYPGYPLTIFTGTRARLDVVRVTWTNGVIQNEMEVETGNDVFIEEEERQTSSCPFLYIWDGARFRFLTDVVGRAPLGEVLPDGSLLPPHSEDYVRIPPGMMAAQEGELVFQVTEELRELAYLDAVELIAVDRPPRLEVFVDEKFSSPPFEPFRLYSIEQRYEPIRAVDAKGDDVLTRIARNDGVYVSGLERRRVPGFAEAHVLELEAPSNLAPDRLWLLLSGWVYWPSSSSMRALASNDTFAPLPPRLEVADGNGGWVTAIDDLGLPSGMGRTLVADVSNRFVAGDRRLRVVTNFEVYWDEAFFAVPATGVRMPTHRLAASSADLHFRGFSRVERARRSEPERYDYETLLTEAPWNATAGAYTRYGERRDRLSVADGRLVVMAPGDELTLRFDQAALPPPPDGLERDWVLHFTGWAKDQDPNTQHSRTVEPLPVSGSPSDDDDGASRRYVPALVPPLAPPSALSRQAERREERP